ncbi:MAG TPA: DUF6093 family protein [Nocardioides sp.]|uniref:DUF6093 family protein n=1 Tax=Nocardioides sp. TaxID=35761 RepID=UPI002ED9FA5B
MPRPTQATGRPGTPVIPADWETAHRVVVERAMRGRVSLRIPGTTQVWSEEDQEMRTVPRAPYAVDVPARVLELNGEAKVIRTGEDTEIVVDFLVTVPAGRDDVATGHLVTVTTSTDPLLTGTTLRVDHVGRGTERFERDLYCTHSD